MIKVYCPLCSSYETEVHSFTQLKDHINRVHAAQIVHYYACPKCPEAFKGKRRLQAHLSVHHASTRYKTKMKTSYLGLVCADCGLYIRVSSARSSNEWRKVQHLMALHAPMHFVPLLVHSARPLKHQPMIRQVLPGTIRDLDDGTYCRHCHKKRYLGRIETKKHLLSGCTVNQYPTRLALAVLPNTSEGTAAFTHGPLFMKHDVTGLLRKCTATIPLTDDVMQLRCRQSFKDLIKIPIFEPIQEEIAYTKYGASASLYGCEGCMTIIASRTLADRHKCRKGPKISLFVSQPAAPCSDLPCHKCGYRCCSVLGLQFHLTMVHDEDYKMDKHIEYMEVGEPSSQDSMDFSEKEAAPIRDEEGIIVDDERPGPSGLQNQSPRYAPEAIMRSRKRKAPAAAAAFDTTLQPEMLHSEQEIKAIREMARNKDNFDKLRHYTDNFCRSGTRIPYTDSQRKDTRLEEYPFFQDVKPTKCLFCHSQRAFYVALPDVREAWIHSFMGQSRSKTYQATFYFYDKQTENKVCGRHFHPTQITEEGCVQSTALPERFIRKCLVCRTDITAGLEMPIYYEDQVTLLSTVPGCVPIVSKMFAMCEKEVQFACPADVLIACEMYPSSLPEGFNEITARHYQPESYAAATLRVPKSDHASTVPGDVSEEPIEHDEALVHSVVEAQPISNPSAMAHGRKRQRRTNCRIVVAQLHSATQRVRSQQNPDNRRRFSNDPEMQRLLDLMYQIEQEMQPNSQDHLQPVDEQYLDDVAAVVRDATETQQHPAGDDGLPEPTEREMRAFLMKERWFQHPEIPENEYAAELDQQPLELMKTLFYTTLLSARTRQQEQPRVQRAAATIAPAVTSAAPTANAARVIPPAASHSSTPAPADPAPRPIRSQPFIREPLVALPAHETPPPPADPAHHPAVHVASPRTEGVRIVEVPSGDKFDCRICHPSIKSADKPRVRLEAEDVDLILDALQLTKGSHRRHVLKLYWQENDEVLLCKEHLTGELRSMETGELCNDCGIHRLQEEGSLHSIHRDESVRFCCRECFVPFDRGELHALRHMQNSHGYALPTEFSLDCPYKDDKFAPCPDDNTSSSIEQYKSHIENQHACQLQKPCNDSSSHYCYLRFRSAESRTLHVKQVERERRRLGNTDKDARCCPLCGTIDLWEEEVDGVKYNHFMMHAFEWTPMCRYDFMETRRGHDAHDHFLTKHYDQTKSECTACSCPLELDLGREKQWINTAHADQHLIIGLSEAKNQTAIYRGDHSRAFLGLFRQ